MKHRYANFFPKSVKTDGKDEKIIVPATAITGREA